MTPFSPGYLVMAKPVGPRCNLHCTYCYYTCKENDFPTGVRCMPEALLKDYIRQRLEAPAGPITHFEWHGGEPTLAGLDFFRSIVRWQRAYCPSGHVFSNGLQTNGLLLNQAWIRFLRQENFSVGLSLDGPADLHDAFRKTADGRPSHARVMEAFRLLKQSGIFCNVLCVLHLKNTAEPDRVYDFFREADVRYLQFLPFVPAADVNREARAAAASAEAMGAFLCRVFDRWIKADVGRIVIQTFDEALRPVYGAPHALCIHRETCGDVAVLEHEGSFYSCDHFVDTAHCLGNLREQSLSSLASDPRLLRFGRNKQDTLPCACRECDVLAFCNGGCPKDRRDTSARGEGGLNYLCAAYQKFFRHARPGLTRLAAHMKAGNALKTFSH